MEAIIDYKIDSGVAQIKLAATKSGNAIDIDFLIQLSQAIKNAINDRSCRVVTISAIGTEFCKGGDLEWMFAEGRKPDPEYHQMFVDCLKLISTAPLPIIACVEGNVTGGGVGVVAACDIVLATENAVFILPEIIVGMIPAIIAPFLLRRMTLARMKYMSLSTRGLPAREAQLFGLVDEVATDGMNQTLNRQLKRLFRSSPRAISDVKKLCEQLDSEELNRQIEIDLNLGISRLEQPDVLEGIQTFAEGFSPPWFQKYKGASNV